jgi:hypothetical protein
VAQELLDTAVADRPNWTLPRLAEEIDPSTSSGALGRADLPLAAIGGAAQKGGFGWRRPRHTLKGRQDADAVDRSGLRGQLLKAQAEAGDIMLLFGDESEALTHPYLAHVWAKKGADLRVPAPGQASKIALIGAFDGARRELIVHTSHRKRSADFIAFLEEIDRRYGPQPGRAAKPPELVEGPARPRQRPDPHQQSNARCS